MEQGEVVAAFALALTFFGGDEKHCTRGDPLPVDERWGRRREEKGNGVGGGVKIRTEGWPWVASSQVDESKGG